MANSNLYEVPQVMVWTCQEALRITMADTHIKPWIPNHALENCIINLLD